MESEDIYFQLRFSFYLGNYEKVLEKWNDNQLADIVEKKQEIYAILAQTLIKLGFVDEEKLGEYNLKNDTFRQLIQIYGKTTCSQTINNLTALKNAPITQKDRFNAKVIYNNSLINFSEYSQFIKENSHSENLDILSQLFFVYYQIWRLDLAEKTLKKMKIINEEDILTHLVNVVWKMFNRKYDNAINILDEVKDKYEQSPKLVTMKVICLIETNKLQQAQKIMMKLFDFFKDKKQCLEETEQCLILLDKICFKLGTKSDYLKLLKEINPKSQYFIQKQQVSQMFDEALAQIN